MEMTRGRNQVQNIAWLHESQRATPLFADLEMNGDGEEEEQEDDDEGASDPVAQDNKRLRGEIATHK